MKYLCGITGILLIALGGTLLATGYGLEREISGYHHEGSILMNDAEYDVFISDVVEAGVDIDDISVLCGVEKHGSKLVMFEYTSVKDMGYGNVEVIYESTNDNVVAVVDVIVLVIGCILLSAGLAVIWEEWS